MAVQSNEIYRAACRLTGPGGQDIVNIHHFRTALESEMSDSSFCTNLCTGLKNMYSSLNAIQSNEYTVADIKIDQVAMVLGQETVTRNMGTYSWPSGYAPGSTDNPLPPQVAGLVKFSTQGVRTLAKKYIPALTVAAQDDTGMFTTTVTTALTAFAAALLNPVVFSEGYSVTAVTWAKRAAAWLPFISAVIDAAASTQRRRKAGVGA